MKGALNYMQIEKLEITNFKGIDSTVVIPQKINVFMGHNGAGKSSRLDALRYVLTGNLPDCPVKYGADTASVTASIDGVEISRSVGKKTGVFVAGKNTTKKSLHEFLNKKYGITSEVIKVITSGELLEQMKSGEFGKFLVQNNIIPLELDMEKLQKIYRFSAKELSEVQACLPSAPKIFGTDELVEAHKFFYDKRTETTRLIKELKARTDMISEKPKRKIETVDKEIAELLSINEKRQMLIEQIKAYNAAVTDRKKKTEHMSEIVKQIKAIHAEKPNPEQQKYLFGQLDTNNKQMHTIEGAISVLQANINVLRQSLSKLNTTMCPLSEKLVCTTDKTSVRSEIEELVEKNIVEKNRLHAELLQIKKRINANQQEIDKYRANEETYSKAIILNNQYMAIKDNMPIIPDKPKDLTEESDVESKLKDLYAEKKIITAYEIAVDSKEKLKIQEENFKVYDSLVKIFDPKGSIFKKVIAFALEPLVTFCNERAKELKMDFSLKMESSAELALYCKTKASSGYMPLSSASSGEKLYLIFLIADMLNALTGTRILLIDDIEKLDIDAMRAFFGLITRDKLIAEYDNVFLAGVDNESLRSVLKDYEAKIQVICC